MTEKLLKANIEAKLDHLLKEKKRLGDEFNKLKQELTEKLKEKKGLEEESIYLKQELAEKEESYGLVSHGPYVIMHASILHWTLSLSICFSSPSNILLNLLALCFSQPDYWKP
ncbi:hypothetical protein QL285_067572 [Trifolium repens]|nr:hypothetical protein QL285_067572 [Trifolium repens]